MTAVVVVITVVAWVLISSLFLIAACVLSARLWGVRVTEKHASKSSRARQDGEVPTTPVSFLQ
jgi:hypothetical protein